MKNMVLINNSRTAGPSNKLLMLFPSFSENLLQDAYIIFQNSVDNFEIVHKTCSLFVWSAVLP